MKSLLLISSLALASTAFSQQIGTNQPSGEDGAFTMHVKSQLVTEQVVIKDKAGNFIPNLKASDFTVTEDGIPQQIRIFEHESLSSATLLPTQDPNEESVKLYKRLARTSIQQSGQYKDKRLIAMYFDMTTMRSDDQLRALQAAEKFTRTQMTVADMVAILRYQGGSVDVLLDFSQDRNQILSVLETLVVGEGQGNDESVRNESSADLGAAFGQDSGEFNIFNTDRQLSALQTAASMLGAMNEKKILLYFASGLRLNGNDNQAQLHATVETAIRSGVSFWPIDTRGLVASAPLGDTSQGSPGGQGMYSGASALAMNDRFQQSQDTLYSLAADTGGKAFVDNNDLNAGIVRAQKAITDYYLIGYYTNNTALNGAFRKIKVTVAESLNASLDYRRGYYENKQFGKFNGTEKERQLEDALMLGDPITELTIAMELNYFRLNSVEYYVPLTVKIPGSELALDKKFGTEHTVIDFICEIKNGVDGNTVTNLRDKVDIKISDATAAELAKRPVEYATGFTLLPGRYNIKFLARDDETGRIGTYQTSFIVPNLNREVNHLPISSVVLSSHRVDNKSALFNTVKGKDQERADSKNPLMSPAGKLIPSVTRVFRPDRELEVFLQAYQGSAATGDKPVQRMPLVAYVSIFRDGKKAIETQPVRAESLPSDRLGTTPIRMKVSLAGLGPGEYNVQVMVLDPPAHRFATWRSSMAIAH